MRGAFSYSPAMTIKIGYARCSTHAQDLEAQRKALLELGVTEDRIYTDHGLTGPGLAQALAALREGMAIARARGKLRGKTPKLSEKQGKELWRMHDTGEYTISDLAEVFSVSRPTVYRMLQRRKSP